MFRPTIIIRSLPLVLALVAMQLTLVIAQPKVYTDVNNSRIAYPIGGIGAGMFCLEGRGAISHLSVRNNPDIFNQPAMFAAIAIKGVANSARVLEGQVPGWKKFGLPGSARGDEGSTFGLARLRDATFSARFPFGKVNLSGPDLPLAVTITGWSPFIPTDADNSSLPVGALEYQFTNTGKNTQDYVFSYNSKNFMAVSGDDGPKGENHIKAISNGFILSQDATGEQPEQQGDFAIWTDEHASVDNCWFRGEWYDPLSMAWNKIKKMDTAAVAPVSKDAPGASLYVSFSLKPGASKTIRVMMAWYVPNTNLRIGNPVAKNTDSTVRDASKNLLSIFHKPWYSSKFADINGVISYWQDNYQTLKKNTGLFTDALYAQTLPAEVMEAVTANLTILKSSTVLRQYDGRFWAWEGCNDSDGSCAGSCTHVWNYAQALPHLFPQLERSLRETEFGEDQDAFGHQQFRAALPIRPLAHDFYAASDGQLGGIMKTYRDWRISADDAWLQGLYPKLKLSLDYCIKTWDPRHHGTLEEPHHNTYDIEFWGPEPMCTSFYLGALEAMIKMGGYLHQDVGLYRDLLQKGKAYMETKLYNGEYFVQNIQWKGLNAPNPVEFAKTGVSYGGSYSPEAAALLQKEGPKYQYGSGCLSDGVIGAWMARVCGLPEPVDTAKVKSHLTAVYRYNEKKDLSTYSNPQRASFAMGNEGGLLLCTWPKGGELSLPFVYSNEVWTGIEYEVASHLIFMGKVKEGLDIVRTARKRYDGTVRNPFDEYECGHWYARAMSSYALIEALTGVRYDAVEKTLYVDSRIGNFTSFLSTASGFGNVIYQNGRASVKTVYGSIDVKQIVIAKTTD